MSWPAWFFLLGLVFSLGFFVGHRLGAEEANFEATLRGPGTRTRRH